MNNYQDRDTFYHDEPCINGEPSSNNRLTYTAYSKYLAPPPSAEDLWSRRVAFTQGVESWKPLKVNRLPEKIYPPMSKDEIIGAVSQKLMRDRDLEASHWNFCNLPDYTPEKLTFKKVKIAVEKMLEVRKLAKEAMRKYKSTGMEEYLDEYNELTHRNYFWKNEVTEVYCLLFWLPYWDQYYVKKFCKERASLLQTIFFYLNVIFVLTKGNKSVRMLLWLQCKDLNHWLLKFINEKKWINDYFQEDHPFRRS